MWGGSGWDLGPPPSPLFPAVVELCLSHGLGPVALANELLAFVTSKDLEPQLTPEGLDAFEHEVGIPPSPLHPKKLRGALAHPPSCPPRCWPSAAGAAGTSAGGSPTTSTRCRSCIPTSRGALLGNGGRELAQIPGRAQGGGQGLSLGGLDPKDERFCP